MVEMGMDKREIEDAKKMCMEAADEAEGACKEANKTIKDVQEYCSDNKYNNNMKEGINWIARQVGQRCEGRSGASILIMTASASVIAASLF